MESNNTRTEEELKLKVETAEKGYNLAVAFKKVSVYKDDLYFWTHLNRYVPYMTIEVYFKESEIKIAQIKVESGKDKYPVDIVYNNKHLQSYISEESAVEEFDELLSDIIFG